MPGETRAREAQDRRTIEALGNELNRDSLHAVEALYADEQRRVANVLPPLASDLAYGPHERHRLDLYAPPASAGPLPVLVWVHGGGFCRGSKGGGDEWQEANAGRMAAQEGMLGAVINYRLAPEHPWPAGAEDLARAVDWLKQEAPSYGGDPDAIVLAGTSAGAAHVAGYLKLCEHRREIAGAILLSGLYGVVEMSNERELSYYGADRTRHAGRIPLPALIETPVPLLVACAEHDPPRFQHEFLGLLERRLERHGRFPRASIVSGHNHYSLAYHLGTADRRLSDDIAAFVQDARS